MAANLKRSPLQGVWTVLRFNWHWHLIGLGVLLGLLAGIAWVPGIWKEVFLIAAIGVGAGLVIPVLATWYAYDATGLYDLSWMSRWLDCNGLAANIHAGFDETTTLLEARFPGVTWQVFDFYDPETHTEVSIRRARKARVPDPRTRSIRTHSIPLDDRALDFAVLMLAAHEVRDPVERAEFFRELKRVLAVGGKVLVVEHVRDAANIAAYSLGAWHFHSRSEWLTTFAQSGFVLSEEYRPNWLITTFVLVPRETSP